MLSIGKTPVLCAAVLGLAASAAGATEYGRVISSTPVVAQVPVTQRECVNEAAPAPRARSGGGGALAGAVVGAAMGNMVGGGLGRAAATGIGMIAGAALGDHAEAQAAAAEPPATRTRCRDVTRTESRAVGYDVVYEYQGVQRSVRLAQPPGDRIALEVSVVPVAPPVQGPPAYTAAAPAPAPVPAPVYRTPAETVWVDDTPPPPAAPPPRVVVNPWPYVVAAGVGAVILSNAWGHGPRGHWRGPRRGH